MSSDDGSDTLLGGALERERRDLGIRDDTGDDDARGETLADTPGLHARKTHLQGDDVDLAEPETTIVFDDEHGLLSGEHGQPRPQDFWVARQLGQTPQMQLIKHAITQQLTGGRVQVVSDDDLSGPLADLADLIENIYQGPHYQEKQLDDLITGAVDSMVDSAWAYWEILPSEDGEFPVAGFKPLPPLQIQHNIDEDTGELLDDPAFYQIPHQRHHGSVQVTEDTPIALDREQVVMMRAPLSAEDDSIYGESIATKVREYLELITDVDVHQKRHYADSQLPSGFLHFLGALDDDDLEEIEQDIVEVSGDPHELVTTTSEEDAKWIPVGGGKVADLEAIQQSKWYFKLVLAAAGLSPGSLSIIEGTGFAKELPAQIKQDFKKVTKPYMSAIFDAQTHQVLPRVFGGFSADVAELDVETLRVDLERFDPLQEQIERDETMKEWSKGVVSMNEIRGALGRDAVEFETELDGEEVDLADLPWRIVQLVMNKDRPELSIGDDADDGMGVE